MALFDSANPLLMAGLGILGANRGSPLSPIGMGAMQGLNLVRQAQDDRARLELARARNQSARETLALQQQQLEQKRLQREAVERSIAALAQDPTLQEKTGQDAGSLAAMMRAGFDPTDLITQAPSNQRMIEFLEGRGESFQGALERVLPQDRGQTSFRFDFGGGGVTGGLPGLFDPDTGKQIAPGDPRTAGTIARVDPKSGKTELLETPAQKRAAIDEQKFLDQASQTETVLNLIDQVADLAPKAGAAERAIGNIPFIGEDLATPDVENLRSATNALATELNKLAELGALTGPDLDILLSQIGNPDDVLRGGYAERLQRLRKNAVDRVRKNMSRFGQSFDDLDENAFPLVRGSFGGDSQQAAVDEPLILTPLPSMEEADELSDDELDAILKQRRRR